MRINFTLFICAAVFSMVACKSSDKDDPKKTTGNITVTAVTSASDKYVYIDDVITINGAGFDADPNKDSVELMIKDQFGNFQTVNVQELGHYFVNQSATSTMIKFKVPDDQLKWFNDQVYQSSYQYGFRVRSNGAVSDVAAIPVRRIFSFNFTYGGINTPIKAGDAVSIDGQYFTDNCSMKISLTRCGKPTFCGVDDFSRCDCDTFVDVPCSGWTFGPTAIDGSSNNMIVSFPLLSVFGITTQDCDKDNYYYQTKVKLENKDGKVAIGYCWIYYRPC